METLDGDDGARLRSGRYGAAVRDIVQFVEFNKFKGSAAALAKETLHEIPGQLISYFAMKKISPKWLLMKSESILH